jgi:ATP-dependent Clp protease ATP-binding subunit ClpB
MDEGRLTDGHGRTVDFKNAVIIMTSNIGSQFITELGKKDEKEIEARVREAMKNYFKPEFLNRVDDIIIFHKLGIEEIKKIVLIGLKKLVEVLEERKIHLEINEDAKLLIAHEGYDPVYGARPLKRVIQNEIQNVLAMKMLNGEILEGGTVFIGTTGPEGKRLSFKVGQ